jgi:hypothetical protein
VPSAAAHAKLVKHAFAFGTWVPSAILSSDGNDNFKQIIPELFNVATLENGLKWVSLSGGALNIYLIVRSRVSSGCVPTGYQYAAHFGLAWLGASAKVFAPVQK